MKKIINNKKYDTETATCLAKISRGYRSDLKYDEEALYRKKTGEYFLYGFSHAGGRWAERIDNNSWCAGERIIPLTEEEARKWGEEELAVEYFEEIFGKVEE